MPEQFEIGKIHNPFDVVHCDCKEEKRTNIVKDRDKDGEFLVEYTAHCVNCGQYLYTFGWGHYEY